MLREGLEEIDALSRPSKESFQLVEKKLERLISVFSPQTFSSHITLLPPNSQKLLELLSIQISQPPIDSLREEVNLLTFPSFTSFNDSFNWTALQDMPLSE